MPFSRVRNPNILPTNRRLSQWFAICCSLRRTQEAEIPDGRAQDYERASLAQFRHWPNMQLGLVRLTRLGRGPSWVKT